MLYPACILLAPCLEGRSASQQEYWQEYWKTDVLLSPCLQALFPLTLVDGTNTKQKWMP